MTEKGVKFEWTDECQKAFETLKVRLTSAPILAFPRDEGQYILDTDVSDVGIGAVLSQVQDAEEKVIAYASSVLNKHERRYCVTRKEMYALVKFVKHFRPNLYGQQFLIRTDHSSLKWLFNFKENEGQIGRCWEVLSEYHSATGQCLDGFGAHWPGSFCFCPQLSGVVTRPPVVLRPVFPQRGRRTCLALPRESDTKLLTKLSVKVLTS